MYTSMVMSCLTFAISDTSDALFRRMPSASSRPGDAARARRGDLAVMGDLPLLPTDTRRDGDDADACRGEEAGPAPAPASPPVLCLGDAPMDAVDMREPASARASPAADRGGVLSYRDSTRDENATWRSDLPVSWAPLGSCASLAMLRLDKPPLPAERLGDAVPASGARASKRALVLARLGVESPVPRVSGSSGAASPRSRAKAARE